MNTSCKSNLSSTNTNYYKILSIDSTADIYVIKAKNKNNYYKIVSKRIDRPLYNYLKIRINKSYKFELVSLLHKEKFTTMIGRIDFYGESILFERDSINDIRTTNNLQGITLLPSKLTRSNQ
ncbi:hypothetical protein [Flavobacterium hibisci]|uniref:hypothetical protein n=1 Tax=Flavobacterium hibisci TaxID=1914462 RepID=UPI001CBD395C|nr:hypothetical protein [Flavobacterium hibisci]MBZ4044562.1 hypothetical protein [Flavobacterium hibisci]